MIDKLYTDYLLTNPISIENILVQLKKATKINYSYQCVYNYIRRAHPRFRADDCQNLVNNLTSMLYDYRAMINPTDSKLTKLIFATSLMKTMYHSLGDVILVDSTFKTNI